MNNDAFDHLLRDWLAEGPERGRAEALDRALAATRRTTQRPRWRQPSWHARRFARINTFAKIALAATGVVGIAVIAFTAVPKSRGVGAALAVQQVWATNQATAVTIQRQDATDTGRYYWRAVTYDQIGLKGWTQTDPTTIVRQPGAHLFDGLADAVDPARLHRFTFTVTPREFRDPTILSPGTPVEVNETTRLAYVGQNGYFATLERDGGSGPYTVTAMTDAAGAPRQLTQADLRGAGSAYPQEVRDLYLQLAPGSVGTNVRKLEDKVRAQAVSSSPFDLASEIVTELHSATYTYATDVRDLDCAALSIAECFATYKHGFCQYYATTMAVVLRDLGVPTRLVEGFLPGTVDRNSGTETIPRSSAHAWVEVYFPGHGWVMFDPTGGGRAQVEPLPPG
jgi:transglutaminase-like putative cysteine protease